jgi:hypothetical protein
MMRKRKKEERKNIIKLPGSLAMFSAFLVFKRIQDQDPYSSFQPYAVQ